MQTCQHLSEIASIIVLCYYSASLTTQLENTQEKKAYEVWFLAILASLPLNRCGINKHIFNSIFSSSLSTIEDIQFLGAVGVNVVWPEGG